MVAISLTVSFFLKYDKIILLNEVLMENNNEVFNKFKLFASFINETYDKNKKILDVGAGHASTSCLLASYGFNVCAMDKFSSYTIERLKRNDICFINDYFSLDTDISCYDLIVGLHCCNAIELIIKSAISNNKEFLVTLCETRKDISNYILIKTREDYINYLMSFDNNIKRHDMPIYVDGECWGHTLYLKK